MPIVKRTAKEIRKSGGRVNWKKVRATTDEKVAAQITADPDTAPESRDVHAFRRVYNPVAPDVKEIRHKLGLSQSEFANRFGFSVRTVQQWEQGRAVPDRPARLLLKVIAHAPQTVERALAS